MEPIEPLDPKLTALFAREQPHIPDEPFLGTFARRIAAERRRRARAARVLQAAGLLAVVVLSPWLVAASQFASGTLESLFGLVADWLSTSEGIFAASLCVAVALIVLLWRRPSIR
jgi:hypothetical protein